MLLILIFNEKFSCELLLMPGSDYTISISSVHSFQTWRNELLGEIM